MSDAIATMLEEARTRARAPTRPWWSGLTKEDLPGLHSEAIASVSPMPANPKLVEAVARVFTWGGYVLPHLRANQDPLKGMVKNLRETLDDFGRRHA